MHYTSRSTFGDNATPEYEQATDRQTNHGRNDHRDQQGSSSNRDRFSKMDDRQYGGRADPEYQMEDRVDLPSINTHSQSTNQPAAQYASRTRTYSSESPSAKWSSSSPAASWGTSQTYTGSQPRSGSTSQSAGQSFLDKAKEYLPGTGTSTGYGTAGTGSAAAHDAQPSLLDRAKEYLPGTASSTAGTGTGTSGGFSTGSPAYGSTQPGIADRVKEYLPGTATSTAGTGTSSSWATGTSGGYGTGTYTSHGTGSSTAYGGTQPGIVDKVKEYLPGTGSSTAATHTSAGTGPSNSYGTTGTGMSNSYGSAEPSLLDKAKEYLPASLTAGTHSATGYDAGQPTLLDKAKEYIPGASTRSAGSWQGSDRSGFNQGSTYEGAHQAGTYSRPGADPVVQGPGSNYSQGMTTQYSSERPWGLASNSSPTYRSNQDAHTTGQSGASLVGQAESDFRQDTGSLGRRSGVESERDSVAGGSSRFAQHGQRDSPISITSQSTFSTTRPGSNYGQDSSYQPSSTYAHQGTNQSNSSYGHDSGNRLGSNHGNESSYRPSSMHATDDGVHSSSNHGHSRGNQPGSNYGHDSSYRQDSDYSNDRANRPSSNYGNDNANRASSNYSSDNAQQGSDYGNNGVNRPSSQYGSDSHRSHQGFASESTAALPSTGIPPPFHPPSYTTQETSRYEPTVATDRQDYYNRGGPSVLGTSDSVHAKEALAPLTEVSAGGQGTNDPVHAKDALAPLTEVPAEGKGIVETVMEYLPGHGHAAHDGQQVQQSTPTDTYNQEAQPSLMDKAKAYIPVLGNSTDFDPASTGRAYQEERLYRDSPKVGEPVGYEGHSPSMMDRARAYIPTMATPGTTSSGYDARTGGSTNEPHHGLVETIKENVEILVEKVQEMLPHHAAEQTGARAAPYGGSAGTAQYTSTEREVDPYISGVRLTSHSTFGTNAGRDSGGYGAAEGAQGPGILDKVKQMVGLGAGTETDQYSSQSSPINANQGVNAGFLGSPQRLESNALGDDDDFQDAFETPAESFTTGDAAYGSANNNDAAYGSPSANNRGYGSANNAGYGSANNTGYVSTANSNRQPYVNQTGPPLVENDPDETFGPVKSKRAQPPPQPAQTNRDPVGFNDESDEEYEIGADGKRGVRSKLKGKVGARREQHHEKQREKADHQLEQKMQEKELPKTNAVMTPAAPEQATPATGGSNLGPGSGGGMMGGVAGGTPGDPQGNAQSEDKAAAEKAPANDKAKDPKDPHAAVKANEHAGGTNIVMGSAAQQRMEEAPQKKSKGGFMNKVKRTFSKNK